MTEGDMISCYKHHVIPWNSSERGGKGCVSASLTIHLGFVNDAFIHQK